MCSARRPILASVLRPTRLLLQYCHDIRRLICWHIPHSSGSEISPSSIPPSPSAAKTHEAPRHESIACSHVVAPDVTPRPKQHNGPSAPQTLSHTSYCTTRHTTTTQTYAPLRSTPSSYEYLYLYHSIQPSKWIPERDNLLRASPRLLIPAWHLLGATRFVRLCRPTKLHPEARHCHECLSRPRTAALSKSRPALRQGLTHRLRQPSPTTQAVI